MSVDKAVAYEFQIRGTVQGVGYRPFVYSLATELGLTGFVYNDTTGVRCVAAGQFTAVQRFQTDLLARAPRLAVVEQVDATEMPIEEHRYSEFSIVSSNSNETRVVPLPVDTYACSDCLHEMRMPSDRRFGYPFINCTNCGPRYSIITDIPYDRISTTMASYKMCVDCTYEYNDVTDRRYHAQPIACNACGPQMIGYDPSNDLYTHGSPAIFVAATILNTAKILAIKGVGGFHLAVDATQEEAVKRLRSVKRRDSKPFAVLARNKESALRIASMSPSEILLLESPQRPIVLARKKEKSDVTSAVAPNNPSIGVMLPSAPHHDLLFDFLDSDFIVLTSGNISGSPIEITNEGAQKKLGPLSDYILMHDRDIANRLDDSVVRYSVPDLGTPYFSYIRRGRGYAPYYLKMPSGSSAASVLACGSELKSTGAVLANGTVYCSQHIGDMSSTETNTAHTDAMSRLVSLYGTEEPIVAADMHPDFFARSREIYKASTAIQHHHAHMAACMVDNGLSDGTYLGVVLDGVGFGSDGQLWGSEFLVGGYRSVRRVSSLRGVPLIGGDAAVRHPVRIAFALGSLAGLEADVLGAVLRLTEQEVFVFERMLVRSINTVQASSMGRLFDGAAALVGLARHSEYEAQGPVEFEGLLGRDHTADNSYPLLSAEMDSRGVRLLDWSSVITALVSDIDRQTSRSVISRRFHTSIAQSIAHEAMTVLESTKSSAVVLSGGVLLNEFLSINIASILQREHIPVYIHTRVPTNDGGICVGQVGVAAHAGVGVLPATLV